MNESQRAVAQVRVRVLHRDMVLCVSQASLRVSCGCFCGRGAARVTRGRSAAFPQTTLRSGTPGRTVGEVEDLRKEACVQRVCCDSRFTVRTRAARDE